MFRSCKLFISVDGRGLLSDAAAISVQMNFDGYESIFNSTTKVLAKFKGLEESQVKIENLFYYKKRARSTRMSPQLLLTSTHAFKALAEHPSGEVPIGVCWQPINPHLKKPKEEPENGGPAKKIKLYEAAEKVADNNDTGIHFYPSTTMLDQAAGTVLRDALTLPEAFRDKPGPKPGARKTASPVPVPTAMYISVAGKGQAGSQQDGSTPKPPIVLLPSHSAGQTSASAATQSILDAVEVEMVKQRWQKENANSTLKNKYNMPKHATCEVVFTYDGVCERRKVTGSLVTKIESLINMELNPESQESVMLPSRLGTSGSTQKHGNSEAFICDLMSAKQEIYKTLSRTTLSANVFKHLLKWMRTLKLEKQSSGKFHLSERSAVSHFQVGVQSGDPCQQLECTSPSGLSDSPKSYTTNEIPSSEKLSSASILSGKYANLTLPESVREKSMSNTGAKMPAGSVKLGDGTYLVPIPGKQIQVGELTSSEKLDVRYIQSASGKILPAHIINAQVSQVMSPLSSTSSSPPIQSPLPRSESPKPKVNPGKGRRSKGSMTERCGNKSENESDEGDKDEQRVYDADKFVIVKTEPVEYSEYDSDDEKQSFLNPGLQISNTVSGAEASAHFEYVIKPEPPDDY
ncbi:uncharacterized protein LOC127850816 isoform X2 [Dreissena polymorpha]|uniref:uncharacterized protein LOC127850816 isoform X2 n=1 Tax=Dreissena polymorpha TaxID=45954 RepID=UPI002264A941|nr:uncharacterized protein LOC127850816 isoform X2 [Dreissena polymorpha]